MRIKLQGLKTRILQHANTEAALELEIENMQHAIAHLYTALTLADTTFTQTRAIITSIINQCRTHENKQTIDMLTCTLNDVDHATVNCLPKISTKVSYISQSIARKRQQISSNAEKIKTLKMLALTIQGQANTLALRTQHIPLNTGETSFFMTNHIEALVNGIERVATLSQKNATKIEKIATKIEQLSQLTQVLSVKWCN